MNADQCLDSEHSEDWLWAEVKTVAAWKAEAPVALSAREKTSWAKERRGSYIAARTERLEAIMTPGTALMVEERDGHVRLLASGVSLASIVVNEAEAPFIAAQWRQIARATHITEKFAAKSLVNKLLSLRQTDNMALQDQVVRLDSEIVELDSKIAGAETAMNALIYRLYGLTADEIRLIEAD